MKEARFVAIVDAPPQITVERPGQDIIMSKPAKVSVELAVHDDFGLANVQLLMQRQAGGLPPPGSSAANDTSTSQKLKQYEGTQTGDTVVTGIDLTQLNLKAGDFDPLPGRSDHWQG